MFVAVLSLSGCSKYDEGPAISLRSKKARVANIWIVESARDIVDDVDITADFTGDSFEWKKDGDYLENGTKEGTWDFDSKKEFIVITKLDNSTDELRIVKLKEKEMILEVPGEEIITFSPQ